MAEMTRRDDPRGRDDAGSAGRPADASDVRPAGTDATVVMPPVGDGPLGSRTGEPSTTAGAPWAPTGTGHERTAEQPGTGGPHDPDDPDASPLAVFEPDERRRRWPRVVATGVGVLVVLGGGYVGASWALADVVPRGTTVAGVDVGGMGRDDALAALESGLSSRAGDDVPVAANGRTTSVPPAAAGLSLDAAATVDGLTGFDLQPGRLWTHLVGNGEVRPAVDVDDAALTAAVTGVAETLVSPPVDGGVVFADGGAHVTPAAEGSAVDEAGAADVLRDDWLTGERPLELPTSSLEPDITQAEAETALTTLGEPFAAAPVVVAVADRTVELPVDVLTSLASFVPQDSELRLAVDGPRLVQEVLARTTNLLTASSDARFEFVNDAPVIVPGTPGTTLDPTALADAVVAAGTGQDRTARVDLVTSDPAQSTQRLESLGVKEVVSEFSTPLTNEPDRTENLRVGASKVTGRLVLPGEVFSLTEALGPVTAEAGFNNATVIVNGEHVPGIGGGLSQMATTTYNAGFFAGFEDVEHQPHSEWFARYPEGRESTLYTGVIDMKFRNTSPYGALLQSWVADGRLHVRIWGTKHFTVETSTSPRSAVVRPTTVHSSSPTCIPQSAGNPGFQVTVTRRVLLAGVEQSTTSDTWRYKPQNAVVCDPPQ
ncbi:VanW family protein [Cellulomonas aerilata]|uniref:Vanomycin resistance protein VanB n=1 Tax=Cellulomonas aerilata TaxID=515326 RepID=A0A512DE20_9CELL|nr:VanW family protein [Cellulomonas aerilata]GEO34708.1 vanomycin resistance protein VanB [Cellulomonas aerilata]